MNEEEMIQKAIRFADERFKAQNILRKYTNTPYIEHPIAVMEIVESVPHTIEQLLAAILHDTVEDTNTTFEEISDNFGEKVTDLVRWLTDVSTKADGNRAVRKAIDRQHSADAPAEAQTIKLADILDNSKSILEHDKSFAAVYLPEKWLQLRVLLKGDPVLRVRALSVVRNGMRSLGLETDA